MELPNPRPGRPYPPSLLLLAVLLACTGEAPERRVGADRIPPGAPPPLPGDASWYLAPGVVAADEVLFLDPGWVLLDGLEGRLHLLDSLPRPVRTVGRRGDGPGELASPRHLVRDPDGFAVVGGDGRLDRFDASGRFLERVRIDLATCPFADVREARRAGSHLLLALVCTVGADRRFLLVRTSDGGRVERVAGHEAGGSGVLRPYGPVLGTAGGRPVWGTGANRCLRLLADEHTPRTDTLCVSGPPIPLSAELRRQVEDAVGGRAPSDGLPVELPDHLPWLDRIVHADEGGVLVRRPVDARRWRLAWLGSPGGLWPVPDGLEVHGGGGRLLLVHHGLEGVWLATLAVTELPLHPRPPGRP